MRPLSARRCPHPWVVTCVPAGFSNYEYTPTDTSPSIGALQVLVAMKNYDRIVERRSAVPKISVTEERFIRNEWLAESLKSYDTYRCQICGHSFQSVYAVDVAETHHVHYLHQGGKDVSTNMTVVCPNHHRIIHATDARFNKATLTYEYPNGLLEPLLLPDHFREEVITKL